MDQEVDQEVQDKIEQASQQVVKEAHKSQRKEYVAQASKKFKREHPGYTTQKQRDYRNLKNKKITCTHKGCEEIFATMGDLRRHLKDLS